MLIVMNHNATQADVDAIVKIVQGYGFDGQAHPRERADRNRGSGE